MKKSTHLFSIVLLFLFGLIACKGCEQHNENHVTLNCPVMDSLVGHGEPGRGVPLDFEEAAICFKEYDTIMKRYGFCHSDSEKAEVNARRGTARGPGAMDTARLITRSESFLGTTMLCWLSRQGLLADDTSKIVTELRLGMYTRDFFEAAAEKYRNVSDSVIDSKIGRIAIFLVPYPKDEQGKRAKPPVVYDFGGLQP